MELSPFSCPGFLLMSGLCTNGHHYLFTHTNIFGELFSLSLNFFPPFQVKGFLFMLFALSVGYNILELNAL